VHLYSSFVVLHLNTNLSDWLGRTTLKWHICSVEWNGES